MSRASIDRAIQYPYAIPSSSFVMLGGRSASWHDHVDAMDFAGRRPILAVGSNQSPEQLARKFPDTDWGLIPVARTRLRHYDTVYSPHISAYGAIPATLYPSPGTEITLFITWLTPEQEERMHETEVSAANYGFGELLSFDLSPEEGPMPDGIYLYAGTRGAMNRDGNPIPLAEVGAHGRRWPAMTQAQVQAHARDRVAGDHDMDRFVLASISDTALRRQRTDRLSADALPFGDPAFRTITIRR